MGKGDRTQKQKVGEMGESVAETFLKSKGFSVVTRNYRKPWGEIDIVAEQGGIVHFVEVKTVTTGTQSRSHDPEDLVDLRKLQKVARTAVLYMESVGDRREFQIDVVGVVMDVEQRQARCRFFEQVL